MFKKLLFIICLFVLGCSIYVMQPPTIGPGEAPPAPAYAIQWQEYDDDTFWQERWGNGKCVFIYFREVSCPECDNFEQDVLSDMEIIQILNDHYINIKVDELYNEQYEEISDRVNIDLTPTLLIVDIMNTDFPAVMVLSARYEGYTSKDRLRSLLMEIIETGECKT